MKYVDEFRRTDQCLQLAERIRRLSARPRTIMEVCGGQTHGLLAHGIDRLLADSVQLLHGPGCPVCVTAAEDIDFAVSLARRSDVTVVSFGDMLRVPGNAESLLQARGTGGDVRIVYSPLDAVRLAAESTDREVVFFAVGFETTAPATALAVRQARKMNLRNFSLLVSHVRVQPAMEMIMQAPDCRVEGFLAAGHVCTVTGCDSFEEFVKQYGVPVVVTGFEPLDLLLGIEECLQLIERTEARVSNRYARSVRSEGNLAAQRHVSEVFAPCDRNWRGIGPVLQGGLRLKEEWREFDAAVRFSHSEPVAVPLSICQSGEVLTGRIRPDACAAFGRECTPTTPLGAPMVSSEGACAAYYRYARTAASTGESAS